MGLNCPNFSKLLFAIKIIYMENSRILFLSILLGGRCGRNGFESRGNKEGDSKEEMRFLYQQGETITGFP